MRSLPGRATEPSVADACKAMRTDRSGESFRRFPAGLQTYIALVVLLYLASAALLLPAARPGVAASLVAIFALTALVRPVPNPLGGISAPILSVIITAALLWRPAEVLVSVGVGTFLGLAALRRNELWRAAINGAGWGLPAAAAAIVARWAMGGRPGLWQLGAVALLAVATYRVTNTAIFSMLRSLRSGRAFFADWSSNITARWWSQLLSAPIAVAIAAVAPRLGTVWAALGLTALAAGVLPIPRQELAYYHLARQALEEIVEAVVKALDRVHAGSRAHGERVSQLAVETGRRLGMSQAALDALHLASRLHDVGMLAPDKRSGEASHAIVGSQCLAQFPNPLIAEIVRAHHDRWDGRDTTDRVKHAMPVGARILAAAESYDSARSGLAPYTSCWSVDATVRHLRTLAGNALDPDVVAVLLDIALEQERRQGAA